MKLPTIAAPFKIIIFRIPDVISLHKVSMSLTLKGFNTVPDGTTVWVAFQYTPKFYNLRVKKSHEVGATPSDFDI